MPGHYLKESYLYSRNVYDRLKPHLGSIDLIYAKGFAAWHTLDRKRKGDQLPPVAIKFHGYEMFQKAPSLKVKLEHYMLRGPVKFHHKHADFVFSYGGKITELIRSLGVPIANIKEVPTGIASSWCREEISRPDQQVRRFVFIGRYERRKGVEELNSALEELKEEENFEMHIVGPIPPSKKIKSEKIIYHGKVMEKDAMIKILDNCEVLVTPSHSEGMPNVIMEGMARGLAVIATDVGAVAAQVGDENGWLVEPGNASSLKACMKNIIDMDDEMLFQKRLASLHKVRSKFTWEEVVQQTVKAMKDCLSTAVAQ
jgi:glycosyltransferase involved in cell wall biosynthesis